MGCREKKEANKVTHSVILCTPRLLPSVAGFGGETRVNLLYNTANMPGVSSSIETHLETAVREIANLSADFDWVGIYRLKGDQLELGPFVGEETSHRTIPVGRGVCGTAVETGQDQNVPDVSSRENYLSCSSRTRSELVVLIRDFEGTILGQVDIDSHKKNAFGPEEETQVRRIANQLGVVWSAQENRK